MTKIEFLSILREQLSGLPEEDIRQSVDYYNEMIEDQIEEGVSEAAAVERIGPVEEIVSQILMDRPRQEPACVPQKSRSRNVWKMAALLIGSPIWFPLFITAAVLIFTMFVLLWAVVITLYAAVLAFAAGALGGLIQCFICVFSGYPAKGVLLLGMGLICAGLTILLFYGTNQIMKWAVQLGKNFLTYIKSRTTRKGVIQ